MSTAIVLLLYGYAILVVMSEWERSTDRWR